MLFWERPDCLVKTLLLDDHVLTQHVVPGNFVCNKDAIHACTLPLQGLHHIDLNCIRNSDVCCEDQLIHCHDSAMSWQQIRPILSFEPFSFSFVAFVSCIRTPTIVLLMVYQLLLLFHWICFWRWCRMSLLR